MTSDPSDELLAFAAALADESRALLESVAGQRPVVDIKGDASYVTETDRLVEARLRERIEARYPGHGILGEEDVRPNSAADCIRIRLASKMFVPPVGDAAVRVPKPPLVVSRSVVAEYRSSSAANKYRVRRGLSVSSTT